jgi:hypothetical protein
MTSTKKAAPRSAKKVVSASKTLWLPDSIKNVSSDEKWANEVIFDLHETLLNWGVPIATIAKQMYPHSNYNPHKMGFYNAGFDPGCNLTPYEWEMVLIQALTHGLYGKLELVDDQIRGQMWNIANAGTRCRINTHVPGASDVSHTDKIPIHTNVAQRLTLELIKRLDLPVDVDKDVDFVYPSKKKDFMAERYIPLLVEDNIETAAGVATYAHACILVPKTYNEGFTCPNVLRLENRSELDTRIIAFFKELKRLDLLRPY